jgi:hypothetical protein
VKIEKNSMLGWRLMKASSVDKLDMTKASSISSKKGAGNKVRCVGYALHSDESTEEKIFDAIGVKEFDLTAVQVAGLSRLVARV